MSGDRILHVAVSGGLAGVGFVAAAISWRMENPLHQTVGPGHVPAVVSACLALLALWQAVAAVRERPAAYGAGDVEGQVGPGRAQSRRCVAAAALIGLSVWVWSVGGYLPGIISVVFGVMLIDRKVKPHWSLLFAVLLGLSLWVLFEVIFKAGLG